MGQELLGVGSGGALECLGLACRNVLGNLI